jgi:hypothetical protein
MSSHKLTAAQRQVLAAHHESDRDEARAILALDGASWVSACQELIAMGLLTWRDGEGYWLNPGEDGVGASGYVSVKKRVLTDAGRAALADTCGQCGASVPRGCTHCTDCATGALS